MGIKRNSLIAITGLTASGKSSLAIKIASSFGDMEIISADSRQVYKNMDIGTGKVAKKETKGVPHHLLDIVSLKEDFTVVDYKKRAEEIIKEIHQKNKTPILCGGTGFYIKAVIEGVVIPQIPPNLPLRAFLEEKTKEELFSVLLKKDPRRAKEIEGMNKRKIIRALEIINETKKPVPQITKNPPPYPVLVLGIDTPLSSLEKKIEKRTEEMMQKGLEEEAKKIFKENRKLARETIGYAEWEGYFIGKITKEEVAENISKNTKDYAKRQMRWFKKEKYITWIKTEKEAIRRVKSFLQ